MGRPYLAAILFKRALFAALRENSMELVEGGNFFSCSSSPSPSVSPSPSSWEAAKAFLDSHRKENGILSAEDDAAYTRMEQEITDLGKEIARLERQEALDAELNRPVNRTAGFCLRCRDFRLRLNAAFLFCLPIPGGHFI